MANIKTRTTAQQSPAKVHFNFDVPMLNSLIKYTQCEYISRSDLHNLQKLLTYTDPELYKSEQPIYVRLSTLKSIVDSMINRGLSSIDLIRSQLSQDFEPGISILDDLKIDKNLLIVSECEYISKFVHEKLQYIEIYQKKDSLIGMLRRIDSTADYNVSYYKTIQDLKTSMGELLASLNNSDTDQGLLREFAFSDANASNILSNVVNKLKKPSSTIQSGIRQLNAILNGGFKSGRLYTILGGSGKFKSGTLLNIADQIRLYNPQISQYENGMRNCVLFVTLENSIEETIERLFDMYSDMDTDIRNMTPEEVIETLRVQGEFNFTSNGIDIFFKYAGNLEINTADLYGYVSDLNNKGFRPICLILDYIKRIDSVHNSNGDERVRMSFVAKELKSFAEFYQIPVITAMQLNREGNTIIDAAMRDNKQDVARFVGSSSIGNAWDIIEDSDWVCLINLEMQVSTQRLFLTMKLLKIREKKRAGVTDYFNHPFVNAKNIRLQPDVIYDEPVSIISLANDLESIREDDDDDNVKHSYSNIQEKKRQDRSSGSIITSIKNSIRGATMDEMIA